MFWSFFSFHIKVGSSNIFPQVNFGVSAKGSRKFKKTHKTHFFAKHKSNSFLKKCFSNNPTIKMPSFVYICFLVLFLGNWNHKFLSEISRIFHLSLSSKLFVHEILRRMMRVWRADFPFQIGVFSSGLQWNFIVKCNRRIPWNFIPNIGAISEPIKFHQISSKCRSWYFIQCDLFHEWSDKIILLFNVFSWMVKNKEKISWNFVKIHFLVELSQNFVWHFHLKLFSQCWLVYATSCHLPVLKKFL